MEHLAVLIERPTIVATAIAGAALVLAASFHCVRRRVGPAASGVLVKSGYALTGASVALMIVAGFLSGR